MDTPRLTVVALTTREARIWDAGIDPHASSAVVGAPRHHRNVHVRTAQQDHLHHRRIDDPVFYDKVIEGIPLTGDILLIGHGRGKANAMLSFVQHAERSRPDVAARVVGAIDNDLTSMTEGQILAAARFWLSHHSLMR
jgi:hypothetical protein